MKHQDQGPVALLARGDMLVLDGHTSNLIVQFIDPDMGGCVTVAAMHMRPHDGLADISIDGEIDERSRVKFARFLESIARGLRHYKPGQVGLDDFPKEDTE